nr:formamidase-like isoform X2 [Ipomoea batatas]
MDTKSYLDKYANVKIKHKPAELTLLFTCSAMIEWLIWFEDTLRPRLVVPVDVKKKPREQNPPLHNRWHPDIPPVAEVKEGELFRVEMVDFSGGGITSQYTAQDIKYADQSIVSSTLLLFLSIAFQC